MSERQTPYPLTWSELEGIAWSAGVRLDDLRPALDALAAEDDDEIEEDLIA